jgi:hypothetical protein
MSHSVYAKCLQFDIFCENLTWADDYFPDGRNCVFQSFELAYILSLESVPGH